MSDTRIKELLNLCGFDFMEDHNRAIETQEALAQVVAERDKLREVLMKMVERYDAGNPVRTADWPTMNVNVCGA